MSELENEEDGCVTLTNLVEIVDEEEKLIEDADAVLGASDDKNCTYLMGYVGRQALYSCLTCKDQSTDKLSAGICLACSLSCHVGHNLVELYTKRQFRCDCGNSKFPVGFACKLCPDKVALNNDNKYNQNFSGLYCTCSRPYPDPEDSIDDEMVQCVICEDWFHKRHLSSSLKFDSEEYEEVMCVRCVQHCSFVWSYVSICKGYMDLKTGLSAYLKKFADNGKVVREEDIAEFFTDLQAKKRQKTDAKQFS
ncbi:hypothetical protein HELRODRAFT_62887 [Helobdella robusta]|uniref:UBR-type domain-containing protein n=1 Tax=Helobdella robusta TaxID=6412 RepID=T1FX68_HELRO|nr:hypothetical protein HELRODRAFT_62887 [Helobdella robusta]ESO12416.1 hypothetical protein HELRODRAFT_62887 [Helobdella robusta]